MHRRRLLCLVASGLAVFSLPARAQTGRQVRRIGFLGLGSAQVDAA